MTLTNVGYRHYPEVPAYTYSGTQSLLLDAANESYAAIFRVSQTGSIRKVGFATTTVTTGATVDVRIETVDATTGNPTGTLWGTNTNVSHTINNTDDNVWLTTAALTADASVTAGDVIAVVIVNPAGSPGNFNIARTSVANTGGFPYSSLYTGTWAKQLDCLRCAVEYSNGSYVAIPGVDPFYSTTTDTSTSGTLYRGCEITPPFKSRCAGFWVWLNNNSTTGVYTAKLFDTDGTTVLSSTTLDTDIMNTGGVYTQRYLWPTPATLNAASKYWLAITSDGTAQLTLYYANYTSTAVRDGCAPLAAAMSWSQATSPTGTGDWTNTGTKVPYIGLILDQYDVSSGGGGPLVGPGRLIRN